MTPCHPHSTRAVQASPSSHPAELGVASGCEIQRADFLLGIPRRAPAWPLSASGPRAARQGQCLRQRRALSPGCLSQQEQGRAGDRGKLAAQTDRGALPLPSPRLSPCVQHKTPGSSPLIARRAANTFPRGSTADTAARAG